MDKPLQYEFAKDGDRNTELPNANAQDNSVSFQSGFTLPYELNPANGGKNIERKDMNEILFRICNAINNTAENIDKWTKIANVNLNSIIERGAYVPADNQYITSANNYPANVNGVLYVFRFDDRDREAISQIYIELAKNTIYTRYSQNAGQSWSEWDTLTLTSELNTAKTQLQNAINTKEDKTYYHTQPLTNINNVNDNRFYSHDLYTQNAFNTVTNYIFNIGAENGAWVRQISFPCTTNAIGVRVTQTKNDINSWGAWDKVVLDSVAKATYRKIADSYTKSQCDSTFLKIANANSTYRKIADSYTKTECDNKFLTKAQYLPIGVGQTWRNVTSQRTKNTEYTNSTGRPIMVAITNNYQDGGKNAHIRINGVNVIRLSNLTNSASLIIPAGAKYGYYTSTDLVIQIWQELR